MGWVKERKQRLRPSRGRSLWARAVLQRLYCVCAFVRCVVRWFGWSNMTDVPVDAGACQCWRSGRATTHRHRDGLKDWPTDDASATNICRLNPLEHRHHNIYYVALRCTASVFYARKQLLLLERLSHRNSVYLSVTRVDQSETVQLGSPNLYRRLPGRL